MSQKKVVKKFLFGATKSDMETINSRKKRTGKSETDVVRDLLQGKDRFGPVAEAIISDVMKKTGKNREEVIEAAVLRMMEAAAKR